MKQNIRILLTHEALMMATALQNENPRPLSHVVEECIRTTYKQKRKADIKTLGWQ